VEAAGLAVRRKISGHWSACEVAPNFQDILIISPFANVNSSLTLRAPMGKLLLYAGLMIDKARYEQRTILAE
jgi:hypothetical protein